VATYYLDTSALVKRYVREQGTGHPTLTFVSADDDQRQVARAEGLAVENPNAHP
jgi:hypothetical protein